MLVVNTKEIFLLNLHQNRVHFPAERNAFVLDHQHGRRDVTCKPAIAFRLLRKQNQMILNENTSENQFLPILRKTQEQKLEKPDTFILLIVSAR